MPSQSWWQWSSWCVHLYIG